MALDKKTSATKTKKAAPKKAAPKKAAPKKAAPKKAAPKKAAPKKAVPPQPKKPAPQEVVPAASDKAAFAPGTLVVHDGRYSIIYSSFPACEAFEELGIEGGGYTWHGLVEHVLREDAPTALKKLDFDPEGSMFCAVSKDLGALHAVARALKKLEDPAVLANLAKTVDLSEYD